jgi:hypothetical protein
MPYPGPKPCPKGAAEGGTMTTEAMGDDEGLLTEQDAAELLQVPLSTLRRWQREGAGPPCLKLAGRCGTGRSPWSAG